MFEPVPDLTKHPNLFEDGRDLVGLVGGEDREPFIGAAVQAFQGLPGAAGGTGIGGQPVLVELLTQVGQELLERPEIGSG